jgi:hypothetical protein
MPSKEIHQLRVNLLRKWEKKRAIVVIFPKTEIKKFPGLYLFGLIARDWPGSAGTTMGVITESKWNIATHWGISFSYDRQRVGLMIIGIEIRNEQELTRFLSEKNQIKHSLYEVCYEGWRKSLLVCHDVKKMKKYEDVTRVIKESGKLTKSVVEEALKFFASRGEEYLSERTPKDLADIILTNHDFTRKIKKSGGKAQVKVKQMQAKREQLTGITIGCYEQDFSLLLALDAIRDAVPGFDIKFNKQFVTEDDISIYRIEIDGFRPEKKIEKAIVKKMVTMKFEKEGVREVPRGFEQYGKAIIPKLLREFSVSKIPQVYISPELTSSEFIHFKLILVRELSSSPWTDKCIMGFDDIKGITVLGCETPKVYQDSEVSVFDLRAETEFFPSTESMYTRIRNSLTDKLGEFRDFSEGMRKLDADKFKEVKRRIKGIDLNLLREFYYGIEDFYRVGGLEQEIIEIVRLGVHLSRRKTNSLKWTEINGSCTLIGMASRTNILPQVLRALEKFDTIVSIIQLGDLSILLLRVENQGKALSQDEVKPAIQTLTQILEDS